MNVPQQTIEILYKMGYRVTRSPYGFTAWKLKNSWFSIKHKTQDEAWKVVAKREGIFLESLLRKEFLVHLPGPKSFVPPKSTGVTTPGTPFVLPKSTGVNTPGKLDIPWGYIREAWEGDILYEPWEDILK